LSERIDIKDRGYIVVAPSLLANGNKYEWLANSSPFDIKPAECPAWLLELIAFDNDYITEINIKKDYPSSNGELIISRCAFINHCVKDSLILSEEDWKFGLIGVLSFSIDAHEIVQKYSENYSGYSYNETQKKINYTLENGGPSCCKTIQEKCGDKFCQNCPYNGKIKSPITLGYVSKSPDLEPVKKSFPLNCLPKIFKDNAVANARAIQCPVGYVASALLGFAAGLIGTSRKIRLKSEWNCNCNLYIVLVGSPSKKKSPAIQTVSKFIDEMEKTYLKEYRQEQDLHSLAMEEYKAANEVWKSQYKEWCKSKEPKGLPPLRPLKSKEPNLKRILTNNTTVEALCSLIALNPKGITLFNDELSAWLRSMNQYKGGRGSDRSIYLEMWNCGRITVDRKEKEPIAIENAFLNIIGGIQPDVLYEIKENGQNDGLTERLLFCYENQSIDPILESFEIPASLKRSLKECLNRLLKLRDTENETIPLSSEAQRFFLESEYEISKRVQLKDFDARFEAVEIKGISYIGRIALILHLVKNATGETLSNQVELETMQQAKEIVEYFLIQARVAFNMISQEPAEKTVNRAVDWIRRKGLIEVRPSRDIVTNKVAGCKKVSEARKMLSEMHDYGYGYWDKPKDRFIFFVN